MVLLESAKLTVRMYKRYVDDGNLKLKALDPGAMWDSSLMRVVYSDENDDRQPDERTAEVVRQIANSVTGMLVWTADFPSSNTSGKLSILDIETWCEETTEGTRTCYSFYRKPMSNPVVIPERSALPRSVKFSTFRQEVSRILRNTSQHLPWSHKSELLSEFSWRLKLSGYPEGFRSQIISEGLAGFFNTVRKRQVSGVQLNRPSEVIRSQRRRTNSANWFKKGGSVYDSVLFVPATTHSALARMLQEHEQTNTQGRASRIKIVEKAGVSMKNMLAPNNPWGVTRCKDPKCFPCSSSTGPMKLSCRTPGIVYNIICTVCEKEGIAAIYIGQSGKNAYTRGGEHVDLFLAGNSSHCMAIHHRVHHPDLPRDTSHYRMIPVRFFKAPVDRQICEALDIYNCKVDILMNSGSEWNAGRLPRASVARPDRR